MSVVYIIEDKKKKKNGNIFIKVGMSKVDVYKRIRKTWWRFRRNKS